MNRDRLLEFPFKLIHPLMTLHLIFKRHNRARIGTGTSSRAHAHIVVEIEAKEGASFEKVLVLQFEFPTAAVERPAMNGVKLLFSLQVYGEVSFVSSFGPEDLDHASVMLRVLSGA